MPKGLEAEEKKNHLEFSESRCGYTRSTTSVDLGFCGVGAS
jgi:hypothetical protein